MNSESEWTKPVGRKNNRIKPKEESLQIASGSSFVFLSISSVRSAFLPIWECKPRIRMLRTCIHRLGAIGEDDSVKLPLNAVKSEYTKFRTISTPNNQYSYEQHCVSPLFTWSTISEPVSYTKGFSGPSTARSSTQPWPLSRAYSQLRRGVANRNNSS